MGIEVESRCGSCKCGKCPLPGHTYSFREEQELKLIHNNLHYDADRECWITSYPWIVNPDLLPNNFGAAFATLKNTEKRLFRDPSWAQKHHEQILDMEERGVARRLDKTKVDNWNCSTEPYIHVKSC